MRILILHHVEAMWDVPESILQNIVKHVAFNPAYDKIILTTLEGSESGYREIDALATHTYEWSYAWESPEYYRENDDEEIAKNLIPVQTCHNWAFLYEWFEELRGHQVDICGGFREECLADLLESLDFMKIPYREVEECIF